MIIPVSLICVLLFSTASAQRSMVYQTQTEVSETVSSRFRIDSATGLIYSFNSTTITKYSSDLSVISTISTSGLDLTAFAAEIVEIGNGKLFYPTSTTLKICTIGSSSIACSSAATALSQGGAIRVSYCPTSGVVFVLSYNGNNKYYYESYSLQSAGQSQAWTSSNSAQVGGTYNSVVSHQFDYVATCKLGLKQVSSGTVYSMTENAVSTESAFLSNSEIVAAHHSSTGTSPKWIMQTSTSITELGGVTASTLTFDAILKSDMATSAIGWKSNAQNSAFYMLEFASGLSQRQSLIKTINVSATEELYGVVKTVIANAAGTTLHLVFQQGNRYILAQYSMSAPASSSLVSSSASRSSSARLSSTISSSVVTSAYALSSSTSRISAASNSYSSTRVSASSSSASSVPSSFSVSTISSTLPVASSTSSNLNSTSAVNGVSTSIHRNASATSAAYTSTIVANSSVVVVSDIVNGTYRSSSHADMSTTVVLLSSEVTAMTGYSAQGSMQASPTIAVSAISASAAVPSSTPTPTADLPTGNAGIVATVSEAVLAFIATSNGRIIAIGAGGALVILIAAMTIVSVRKSQRKSNAGGRYDKEQGAVSMQPLADPIAEVAYPTDQSDAFQTIEEVETPTDNQMDGQTEQSYTE